MAVLKFIEKRNRWEWKGSFEERTIAKEAGFFWDGLNKVWYTNDDRKARKLDKYIVVDLPPDTTDVNTLDKANPAYASYALTSDIEVEAPEGLAYREYQKAAIDFLVNRHKAALLADPPGAGKTIEIAGYLNKLHENTPDYNLRVLIVSPASLVLTWERELKKWLTYDAYVYVFRSGGRKSKVSFAEPDICICSYEKLCSLFAPYYEMKKDRNGYVQFSMKPEIQKYYDVVVLDEAHYCKSETSRRTWVALSFAAGACRRVYMTGTPMLNRPIELWPLVHTLRPDIFPDKERYAYHFCQRHLREVWIKNKNGMPTKKMVWDESGAANIPELNRILRENMMIRREKKDILPELPAKMVQTVVLPAKPDELAEEMEIWHRMVSRYGVDDAILKMFGSSVGSDDMGEMAQIRQRVALAKIPYVLEFVENLISSGERKVIIMAHHRAVVAELVEKFKAAKYNPVTVVGGMSTDEKQKAVDNFQNNPEVHVFIGNIRAAGVGLTLTASHSVVFAELDFTPGVMEQAMDRAHRLGQTETVNVYQLVLEDSLDSYLIEMLQYKDNIAKELTK